MPHEGTRAAAFCSHSTFAVYRLPGVGMAGWLCARGRSDMRGGLAEVPAAECRRTAGSRHSAAGGQAADLSTGKPPAPDESKAEHIQAEHPVPRPCAQASGRDAPSKKTLLFGR